jgi:stage II sporulation protein D
MRRPLTFLLWLAIMLSCLPAYLAAQKIDVRVFSQTNTSEVHFTVVKGYYHIEGGGFQKTLSRFQDISLRAEGGKVALFRNNRHLASEAGFTIRGSHEENIFRLNIPGQRERDYDDHLIVQVKGNRLVLVNRVDLEKYVAGVVLSEVGRIEVPEYYKVQDIISRTYALNNLNRHKAEGFHLCDAEHCQVYKNRCTLPIIRESAALTRGDVIVDSSGALITAAFHSNSGGMTLNSEDVWSQSLPYLKAVNDSFGLVMSKAAWQDTIPLSKWLAYLGNKYHLAWEEEIIGQLIRFEQQERKTHLLPGIPLKEIRADWQFRSTWFEIEPQGDFLVFRGKGWGHGVGLSQQGAIRMIEKGFDYQEVIRHYYQGVRIVPHSALHIKGLH